MIWAVSPRQSHWIPLAIMALGVLAGGRSATAASEAPGTVLEQAYDLAYNLDHDQAVETLLRTLEEHPTDPSAHRGIAALTWLRMLFLRGQVLVDSQMTATFNSRGRKQDPPAELDEVFHMHIGRSIELSEDAVRRAPNDPEVHYQLGASLALVASYTATIEGESLRALRAAKRAYAEHEKALELDPTRKDANLTLGLYRYLVSLLPGPVRMMAYLVGFDGGKEEAMRLVEEAAAYPGDSEAEAKFALVLLYNREKEFDRAQRVLTELKQRYPRNRLVWLESASTWLRDERAAMAERDLTAAERGSHGCMGASVRGGQCAGRARGDRDRAHARPLALSPALAGHHQRRRAPHQLEPATPNATHSTGGAAR